VVVMNGDGDRDEPVAGSLFAYLGQELRDFLVNDGVSRSFAAGEVLLRYGDPTTHVLLLVHGWVRVSVLARDGQQILCGLRGPGDVLGDLAAMHGWPRTATVSALEDVQVVQLTSARFVASLHERPGIAIAMVNQMAGRLREAEAARVDFATLGVDQRVAAYLRRLADQHGVRGRDGVVIGMPLTQQDIANRVGASRRAVARSMALLRERRIVCTSRRRIVLRRPDVLASFARCEPEGTQRE
jgi:CRP/FNR family transcriptional regulator, cyclic AMP receptor protein